MIYLSSVKQKSADCFADIFYFIFFEVAGAGKTWETSYNPSVKHKVCVLTN